MFLHSCKIDLQAADVGGWGEIGTVVCQNLRDFVDGDSKQLLGVLHFNIRSLRKNLDEMLIYLHTIDIENVSVIILSETWRLDEVSDFIIPGFFMYYNESYYNQNDGVVVYVKCNLNITEAVIPLTHTKLIRLTVEVDNLKIGITASYRPPSANLQQYIFDLDNFFTTLHNENIEIFVGDININILHNNVDDIHAVNYLANMSRHGFFSYINKPTRITEHTESLIDHLFVRVGASYISKSKVSLASFIFHIALTDHFPIALSIKQNNHFTKLKKNVSLTNYRSEIDYNKLIKCLKKETWQEVLQLRSVHTCCDLFMKKLINYKAECTKQIKINNRRDEKIKPWITIAIINSIKHRDKLKKKIISSKNLQDKLIYKQYRNFLNKVIKKTKNEYYKIKLKNAQKDFRKVWETISEVTNNKKNSGIP